MRPLVLILMASVAVAAAEVAAPSAGVLVTRDGTVREVAGVAGACILGAPLADGALAAAASGRAVVVKFERTVRFGDATFDAPEGPAVLGISRDGSAAVAWFPGTRQFARISAAGVETLPVEATDDVVAVALGRTLDVYARRDDGLHRLGFRLSDGALESDTALDISPDTFAVLAGGVLAWSNGNVLTVRQPEGEDRRVEAPAAVTSIAAMGDGWLHVRAGDNDLAIAVRPDKITLSYLPEVTQ